MLYRPNTRWTWIFFVSTFIEAVVLISLEAVIFSSLWGNIGPYARAIATSQTIPSFFSLVTLGLVYQLLLVYDTLANQSTIQVVGLGIYSATMSVYNGLQYNQLRDVIRDLIEHVVISEGTWPPIRGLLIAIIVITASFTFWIQFSAWKLYEEFAWITLRKVEADIEMRRRYLHFELLLSLLKFDGFFFLGFLVQLAIVPSIHTSPTFAATVVLIPTSCCLLFATASVIRYESRLGTVAISALHLSLIGFFVYIFTCFYSTPYYVEYLPARRTLSFFGVVTMALALATVIMIYLCYRNFHKGLRPYISGGSKARLLGETFEVELREGYLRVPHNAT
ncbi:hypothetical protein BDV23DRAFT_175148 [Aspergillus alliaceus]|uniref:Uncharacterized protein n=1 Tax=Petromyces alliaceus TaxID=209559 RepID=A0A5N7BYA5_PETAA|nr:hypothetical protein BDV23DRAFT_175148 [Aspergillus alliaceus]